MEKFLHNWWGVIPSLQISRIRRFVFLSLLTLSVTGVQAQTAVKFNDGIRYSQWVIESRLGDFYGNTNDFGFTTYNRDLTVKKEVTRWKNGKADPGIDYVAGLVAKATIEAADYYKAFDWAKPWFKSVEWYGNECEVPTSPDNLDAINASKMYFGIYSLTNSTDGAFKNDANASSTASNATTQLGNALAALKHYNDTYAFPASTTLNSKNIAGGWYHKSSYSEQMWLDGQYMGPATLAQLIKGYSSYSTNKVSDNDWKLVTKQFSIVWDQCWDETEKLLYHAFSSKALTYWAGDAEIWTTVKTDKTKWKSMTDPGHSVAFWGRAEGWYFLALVDVLEQMQNAGLSESTNSNHSCYTTLKGYLDKLAAGIKAKQDATSGCWYQLIGKDGNYKASYYRGNSYTETSNYLESSCTAIFAAAYLKAIRLNLLDETTYKDTAIKAYQGVVNQFMKQRADGTVDLLSCCKSAGLGTSSNFSDDKFRDGSNAYYLLGKDVTPTSTNSGDYYTEGKVMGAFILAATEYERQYQCSMLLSQDLKDSYTINSGGEISVEVLGNGSASYQWYKDGKAVDDETKASFKPAESGSYYCEITVTSNSASAKSVAKAASQSDEYTFTTKTAQVTVAAAPVLYTVTFNAGTNGTCSTTSLTQERQGASITLPSVTPKTGYKFDGWYDAETGGNKAGDAGATYTPTGDNITLYAHYTSTGGSVTGEVIYFTSGTKSSNENVLKVIEGSKKTGSSVTYNGKNYSNGVKMESSTDISLTLTAESDVTFVFDTPNKDFKVGETTYTSGSDGTCKITLQPNTYSIKKVNTSVALYAVDIKSTGPSISFTTQPVVSATYLAGAANPAALTVKAEVNNVTGTAPEISYQWYSNTTNSTEGGSEIKDSTKVSYTPDVKTTGTTYYYCKATATVDAKLLEAYSNIATITVSEPMLTIKTQPVGATYGLDQSDVEPLIVVAETNTGNTITYQWYKNSTNSTKDPAPTLITGATSSEYKPEVKKIGTTYYYCVVKAGESLTATTNIVAIVVNDEQPIYGYKVSGEGLTAPGINTSMYITTTSDETGETGEKLVKMTFGGWKWNGGKYVKPNSETEIQDTWRTSETVSGVTVLDGYSYWFSGTQDAVQEDKTAVTEMYKKPRYGWFVSPTRDTTGVTTESHPYTLPVRGSFMTFEPTKNGTLTIYILQNGAWNTFDKATTLDGVSYEKGDIKPGEFRMHAFQVTNQRGLVLAEFAPKYTVTNKQKVNAEYSCTKYADSVKPTTFDNTSKDISDWKEFWDLEPEERQAVHDNWSVESNGGCQEIIKLKNGSFLAIQKAVVKYQFHVTGNETYYFFSNFSKMGFSGATFQPDGVSGQPKDETTFSGDDNSLSDIKAFPTIEITKLGTIEGTDMTNYNYKINGTDFDKVDGVFIPQFKAITLNREFKKDQWTTLTLPFNLMQSEIEEIFGVGTRLIVLDKGTNNSGVVRLKFVYHEIQNVLPGYPYLIKPTQDVTTFTVQNKCINPHISQLDIDCGDYIFKGVTGYCTPGADGYSVPFDEGDIFVSNGDGKLYISGGNSYSKGYRAYIAKKPGTQPAKSISIVMNSFSDDDDTTTSIDVAEFDPTLLESLGLPVGVYNLNGQRVGNDTRNLRPGIYIVNGKKTVVK